MRCGIYPVFPIIPGRPPPPPALDTYPLVKSSVHYTVADVNVHARVTQTYVSNASQAQNVIYVFPLPSDAAVCGFNAVIDDKRTIHGVVKQKDEAKRDYDKAVSEGKTAGLLNQHTASVFQVSLGNLKPKQKIAVNIEYASVISHDGKLDSLRLTLPLSIAPNYGTPPASLASLQPTFRAIRKTSRAFELTMEFNMTANISSISSSSHPISLSLGTRSPDTESSFDPTKAHVSFGTDDYLDKDVVVVLKAEKLDHPRCVVERRVVNGSVSDALSLSLVPRFNLPPLQEQEYIFLIDRSGSMQGGRITAVRAALQIMLRSLPSKGTRFNLISFGSRCDSLWPQSTEYSSESVETATSHVDGMQANYGGTEIRSALQLAFDSRPVSLRSKPTMILLLTDGEAWDIEGVLKVTQDAVTDSNGALRVFVLGVGNQVSTNMCDSIARAGRGVASYVGEQEKPDAKLINLLKAARGAAVTDIAIDWGVADPKPDTPADDFEIIDAADAPVNTSASPPPPPQPISLFNPTFSDTHDQSSLGPVDIPVDLPPVPRIQSSDLSKVGALYPGFRTSVFAIVQQSNAATTSPSNITVKGKVLGNDVALQVAVTAATPLQAAGAESTNFVHVLAARSLVQTLEDETAKTAVVKAKIARLGTTYGLSSSQTSFIAIDDEGNTQESEEVQPPEQDIPIAATRHVAMPVMAVPPQMRMLSTTSMSGAAIGSMPDSRRASKRFSPFSFRKMASAPVGPATINSTSEAVQAPERALSVAPPPPSGAPSPPTRSTGASFLKTLTRAAGGRPSPPAAMEAPPVVEGSLSQHLQKALSSRSTPLGLGGNDQDSDEIDPPLGSESVSAKTKQRPAGSPTIETLARAQAFDGSFDGTPDFYATLSANSLMGSAPSILKGVSEIEAGLRTKVWATTVALAYLRKHFASDEDSWSLLAEKARDFVVGILGSTGLGEDEIDGLLKDWIKAAQDGLALSSLS